MKISSIVLAGLIGLAVQSPVAALVITTAPTAQVFVTSATIRWTTDQPSDSWVAWGYRNLSYIYETYDPTQTRNHQVVLRDLFPGTSFYTFAWSKNAGRADDTKSLFIFQTKPPNPSAPFDFTVSIFGGQHLYQGGGMFISLHPRTISGVFKNAFAFTVDPPPAGMSVALTFTNVYGNAPGLKEVAYIRAAASTPPGTYTLRFHVTNQGVTRSLTHTVTVDPVARMVQPTISSVPPLPNLKIWEDLMTANQIGSFRGGKYFCDKEAIEAQGTYEANIWFYDGARAYFQIADYTKDRSWEQCAAYVRDFYRGWVLETGGVMAAWRYFPHGLYMHYQQSSDPLSKQAIAEMAINEGPNAYWNFIAGDNMRDLAYFLETQLIAQALGLSVRKGDGYASIEMTADLVFSQLDQVTVSKTTPYYLPFMVGLSMTSLIEYYNVTKDPRVLPALKKAADFIWDNAWVPTEQAFLFNSIDDAGAEAQSMQLLNFLIAPSYAWIWAMSGEAKYQERADELFEGGVRGLQEGQLWYGKQFSQTYRLSFDYVKWRRNPATAWNGSLPPAASVVSQPLQPKVFPNPWRGDRHAGKKVSFSGLVAGTRLKIFTIAGHLVRTLNADGPSLEWDRQTEHGDPTASGLYLYVADDTQGRSARGKFALIK